MNTLQKTHLREWSKRKTVKTSGGTITLATLEDDLFRRFRFNKEQAYIDYITNVHPVLYYYYLGNWEKDTRVLTNPIDFWFNISKEWMEECFKQKYWNYGMLDIYRNTTELKEELNKLFTRKQQYWGSGYQEAEEHLYEIQQAKLDNEKAIKEEEAKRIQQAKELAELQVKEASSQAETEKEKTIKKVSVKRVSKKAKVDVDIFDEIPSLFDTEDPEFLKPQYYHPDKMEVSIVPTIKNDPDFNLLEFSPTLTERILESKMLNMRFTIDPKDNKLIIYYSNKLGIEWSDTIINNNKSYLQVYSKQAIKELNKFFNKQNIAILKLSDNISTLDSVIAFKVLEVN